MECETQQVHEPETAMHRPLLLRVKYAANDAEFHARCERVVAAGFDGIELALRVSDRGDPAASTGRAVQSLEGLASSNLKATALATGCMAHDVTAAVEEVEVLLQRAAGLHASCLNLTVPPLCGPPGLPGFTRYSDALNFAYELLHRARHEAEATGVAIALEAGANRSLLSPVELREIIDAANSWAIGACIDVTRIARIGSPVDWITTLRHRVHAVRVDDDQASRESKMDALLQNSDVNSVARALDEIAYDRPVIVSSTAEPDRARAYLDRLGGTVTAREPRQ
jgi:sugar phosphate isomerase/epimerase